MGAEGESTEVDVDLPADVKFSPEEEATLLAESNVLKSEANDMFASGKYNSAISKYDEAIAVCPNYLEFELAVLKSNISACHVKLEEWKEAVDSASAALDGLDRLDGHERAEKEKTAKAEQEADSTDVVDEEIVSLGATKAGPALADEGSTHAAAQRKLEDDRARIKAKALMRRARARSELGGWSNLAGAEEDYKVLSSMTQLGQMDRKTVQAQLKSLPARTKAAQEKEMGEMWGKLKELGNGILKPFGLSTENFQMVQDEKTGGYSMNFKSNGQ